MQTYSPKQPNTSSLSYLAEMADRILNFREGLMHEMRGDHRLLRARRTVDHADDSLQRSHAVGRVRVHHRDDARMRRAVGLNAVKSTRTGHWTHIAIDDARPRTGDTLTSENRDTRRVLISRPIRRQLT